MTSGEEGKEVQGGDEGRKNKREKKVSERETDRKATFFNHFTYLIAMNNKCVGLQLGEVCNGAMCVCVCRWW